MIKRAAVTLIILNLTSIVCAASLGISPSSIEFKSKVGERACSKVVLFTAYNSTLIGESRWVEDKKQEKDIRYYTLKPESLGITLEYPKDLKVENKKEIEICFNSKKEGEHYGALIYSIEKKPVAVGTWIHARTYGKLKQDKLTGTFLALEPINKTYAALYFSTFLLFLIFLILLVVMKKIANQNP